MESCTSKRADLAPTQWRQSMFGRAALWLSHGDNAFHAMLFIVTPPLVALVMIGMVG